MTPSANSTLDSRKNYKNHILAMLVLTSLTSLFILTNAQAQTIDTNTPVELATERNNDVLKQDNSRYSALKKTIFETPYIELPQYKVKKKFFGQEKKLDENKLLKAARRTFTNSDDLIDLETPHKLLNANGICFSGTWKINETTDYTGLFNNSTSVPVIARASVALSGTKQKNKRAFGMAIKFLPSDLRDEPTLNAFVLHSMGGTINKHVLDLPMDNEPPLGRLPKFSDLSTALRLKRDLEKADKELGATKPDASFRPINLLAQYNSSKAVSPRWLRLSALTTERVDKNDFRDELNVKHYSNQAIQYQIEVAGDHKLETKKKNVQWKAIGVLELTNSVTSATCDLNLHFQHPKLNNQ